MRENVRLDWFGG